MKTDDLIAMLATGSGAVVAGMSRRRFMRALGWGGLGTLLLMVVLLGVRSDLPRMAL